MHLHLDLVGGISGDMFIGAMLDVFPEYGPGLEEQIRRAGFAQMVSLQFGKFEDGILSGHHFKVTAESDATGHHHRHYSEIKSILEKSNLDARTKSIALEIFLILATAEAEIHNKSIEKVAFHEVGAWDSIADVVCASYLITASGLTSISLSALPLGGGQVKTAHGMLPVPAPATALILKGFEFVDDGISGERITPTGAAILKFLTSQLHHSSLHPSSLQQIGIKSSLISQGFGLGTKKFPGISNVLRILQFKMELQPVKKELQPVKEELQPVKKELQPIEKEHQPAWKSETISQLEFELDDQTGEEIANALDNIRQLSGVLDVVQYSVAAKKNRLANAIRILCEPDATNIITEACFEQTTTLGIRQTTMQRNFLARSESNTTFEGQNYQLKVATRPSGKTVKAEMDNFVDNLKLSQQRHIRWQVENKHLSAIADEDNNHD